MIYIWSHKLICACNFNIDSIDHNRVNILEADLGDKNIKASMLVVPTELIYIVFSTKGFAIALNVVEEIFILSSPP